MVVGGINVGQILESRRGTLDKALEQQEKWEWLPLPEGHFF